MAIRSFQHVKIYKKLLSTFLGFLVLAGCTSQNPPVVASPAIGPPGVCACGAPWDTNLLFFAWDSTALSPTNRSAVARVAADSKAQGFTPIRVAGYSDTSGNSGDNLKLSAKRAWVVAQLLVAEGVPEKWITIKAFGDTDLLIPTGPGVHDERNRRVEISRDKANPNS